MDRVAETGDNNPEMPAVIPFLGEIAALDAAFRTLPEPGESAYYTQISGILERNMPAFYAAYDAYLSAVLNLENRPVTCSNNCSGCCHHFVSSVEPFELIALHKHLQAREDYPDLLFSSHRKSMVYERILGEEGDDEEADDRALHRYFLRGLPCPFLRKDHSCGVYAFRPMSCRMFYSESAPRFCSGKAIASPWNKNFQIELPQEAEEALARCSERLKGLELPGELLPGVVFANALFGRFDSGAEPGPG